MYLLLNGYTLADATTVSTDDSTDIPDLTTGLENRAFAFPLGTSGRVTFFVESDRALTGTIRFRGPGGTYLDHTATFAIAGSGTQIHSEEVAFEVSDVSIKLQNASGGAATVGVGVEAVQ